MLEELEELHGDVVYFQDRIYSEKMQHDYTELLYNLEQVRLRVYFGGIQPAVPTQDARKTTDGEKLDRLDENDQLNDANPPLALSSTDPSALPAIYGNSAKSATPKGSASYSMEIAVAIKRDNSEHILDSKSSRSLGSYNGRLQRIVKERGDADLNALKEELHRKHMEQIAAEAAKKLEVQDSENILN